MAQKKGNKFFMLQKINNGLKELKEKAEEEGENMQSVKFREKVIYYQNLFGLENWKINTYFEKKLEVATKTIADPLIFYCKYVDW